MMMKNVLSKNDEAAPSRVGSFCISPLVQSFYLEDCKLNQQVSVQSLSRAGATTLFQDPSRCPYSCTNRRQNLSVGSPSNWPKWGRAIWASWCSCPEAPIC